MSNLSLEHNQLKQTLKEAIIEIFSENKEEFSAILTEIIKDIALLLNYFDIFGSIKETYTRGSNIYNLSI